MGEGIERESYAIHGPLVCSRRVQLAGVQFLRLTDSRRTPLRHLTQPKHKKGYVIWLAVVDKRPDGRIGFGVELNDVSDKHCGRAHEKVKTVPIQGSTPGIDGHL